ncbi:MAG TPA: CPBP family intramembrane metalloprotease [Polyangiaceae bacterium]|nr:CPBP family intramembrane metalloprotease [Polyangiaceae bacterium]
MSWPRPRVALVIAVATSVVVTAVSRLAPDDIANTAVGAVFLGVTWWLVLRGDTERVRAFGLSLGGVTEPEPLDARRIGGDFAKALGWALLFAAIFLPPFWLGYRWWWQVDQPLRLALPPDYASRVMGQLLVIALPEEAFFRGYLQSALDGAWGTKVRILGADVGWGLLVSAAIFAVGHVLTIPHPARLAVFFPALLFGWMRARTGGIGASVLFHAMCNLLSSLLAGGYGLSG